MQKVVVFGANGFVGRYMTQELMNHNYQVICVDVLGAEIFSGPRYEYRKCDILNREAVFQLIENTHPDFIINLAGVSSVSQSWDIPGITMDVNVTGTINILEGVRKKGFKTRILLIGSSEEYAPSDTRLSEQSVIEPRNPYALSKYSQELIADFYEKQFGLDIVCTRTFNHTGIGQKPIFVIPSFVLQVVEIVKGKRNNIIMVGDLSIKRDIGNVKDMVLAYRLLLESGEKGKFNIGSGAVESLKSILDYIIIMSRADVVTEVQKDRIRRCDNPVVWCDNSKLIDVIGFHYKYSLKDTIREMYEYYLSNELD